LKPLDLCVDECNKLKPFHITQDTVGDESQAKGPPKALFLCIYEDANPRQPRPVRPTWHEDLAKPRSTRKSSLPFATGVSNSDQLSRR
jgi:hypothetical protein